MAAAKTGGQLKAAPLSAVQIGRMITRLRSHSQYKVRYNTRYYWRRVRVGSWYSDADIRAALGLTQSQFDRCLKEYEENGFPGRRWNRDKVEKAFNKFVHENKRWPSKWDSQNWRVTGLPYAETMLTHWSGRWRLIENYCNRFEKRLTPQLVFSIPNITTRRDVIRRIGIEKLIQGGRVIQQDDFGKLWRLPTDGVDPHMLYVEVVNKSPQINETTGEVVKDTAGNPVFDHYFLRVPHNMRSAKDAVAWTLNIPAPEFAGFAAES